MTQVTKLDGEVILLRDDQIKHIAFCPEIKVVLTSGEECIVKAVLFCKNTGKESRQ